MRGWVDSPANSSPASATRAWRRDASAPGGRCRVGPGGRVALVLPLLARRLRLENAGRPEASLPFYEQAAAQARSGTAAGAETVVGHGRVSAGSPQTGRALFATGNVDGSRQRFIESTEAKRKAGASPASVIVSELEVLRIDILRGQITDVLPRVETRLRQVEAWWQRYRSGQMVPEAPDPEYLALHSPPHSTLLLTPTLPTGTGSRHCVASMPYWR